MGIEYHIESILDELNIDLEDENFRETPRRFAAYLLEHFNGADEIEQHAEFAAATFPSTYRGMVMLNEIDVHGMCPHHLLPVRYQISVAYIPEERVIGLSKLARLADLYGRKPMLQEDVTTRIADSLAELLVTPHVAVLVKGQHSCMSVRGVRVDAVTTTSAVRGDFLKDAETRAEYLALRK